jgi:fructose-bisphosphate aldolase class 1
VPIIEPEILLDGTHTIEQNFEVASWVWAETFKAMMDQVITASPSMFLAVFIRVLITSNSGP